VCLKYALLVYLIFSGIIFAQSFSKSSVNIKVKIVNGAMLDVVKYNTENNDFSKMIIEKIKKHETKGILLRFASGKSNNIIIDYEYSETLNNKPSKDFIVFKPVAREINSVTSENVFKVMKVSSVNLNEKDNAEMYLWIDGNFRSPSSFCRNNSETFTISLAYD